MKILAHLERVCLEEEKLIIYRVWERFKGENVGRRTGIQQEMNKSFPSSSEVFVPNHAS